MLKRIFLLAFVLFISMNFFGQAKDSIHGTTLSINLPGIIDIFDQNFTFGGEFKISKLCAVGTDAGYIFSSIYTSNAETTSGFLVRPFIRFYSDNKEEFFFQAQLHYKAVTYKKQGWVNREVVNGVPTFTELATIDYYKRAYGIHLLGGNRKHLLKNNNHLLVETTIGLGYRYKKEYSEDGSFRSTGFVFGSRDKSSTAVLLFNLKLCYKL